MILPIRCYTCGKILANLAVAWEKYKRKQGEEEDWFPFFEKYKIQRYCCKRILMAQVPDANHVKSYVLPPSIHISTDTVSNMFLAR